MHKFAATALGTAGLALSLSACGGGSGSAMSDQQAIKAAGAKNCVQDQGKIMVRAQYSCEGNLTLSTFASSQVREAMAELAESAGFQTIVEQDGNWMLTQDV